MKRLLVLAIVVVGLLGLFVCTVQWRIRYDSPETLVKRFRRARSKDAREELAMKLSLSKKDPVTPLLTAFESAAEDTGFRMDVLELLFKRNLHAPEDRIEEVLVKSLKDSDVVLRRQAAKWFGTYVMDSSHSAMAECVSDPDPEVRRYAYEVFASNSYRYRGRWNALVQESEDSKKKLVDKCLEQMTTEEAPELRYLARSIVGRQIGDLCDDSRERLQSGDIVEAEELLNEALALDPENHRARIRLVRHHLKSGDREKALKLADRYDALLRIPLLSSAPVVDGDPTDQAWQDVFSSERFYLTTSAWTAKLAEGKSRFHIGHHGGRIYVTVLGFEDDLDALVVKHILRDSDVWRDDCVEIYFDPSCTEKEVYQFVINPAGALRDKFLMDSGFNVECEYAAKVFKDRGYWACEFAVETSALDEIPVAEDSVWGINIMRARIGIGSEHCQWWPTFVHAHQYHLFPIAVFEME